MRGLVCKDFLVVLRVGKVYLAALGIYFCLTLVGLFDAGFFSSFLAIIVVTIPLSSFTYDESARWNKFAAATPAGRDGVVRGKYCFLLLSGVLLSAAMLVILTLFCAFKGTWAQLPELLAVAVAVTCASLFVNLVVFPLIFRFGPEKGRILMMVFFLALFLMTLGLTHLLAGGEALPDPARLPGWADVGIPAALLVLDISGFAVSYRISLGLVRRQEF